MINSWSLLYEELNGTMDKTYPVENNESNDENINITTGIGSTGLYNIPDSGYPLDDITFSSGSGDTYTGDGFGDFRVGAAETVETLNINIPDGYISSFGDDIISFDTPTPGIELDNPRKYKEDESIKALQDYISTTYGGHYTSKQNNVQTLDLIESVGDAESFCRSNAIKYLSRYDKKGQAKRDILKALHYTLLLYHFSGQLNETTTRGYETF